MTIKTTEWQLKTQNDKDTVTKNKVPNRQTTPNKIFTENIHTWLYTWIWNETGFMSSNGPII